MPVEQQLKIPLVDGWQNHKLSSRPYPTGRKDRELIDQTFDKLHEQGRMEWVDGLTPFTTPIFVVWRHVHGKEKGRVVVDLRPLNRVAIPDNYPLPLQSTIIESLRGKGYVTVVGATAFFRQF